MLDEEGVSVGVDVRSRLVGEACPIVVTNGPLFGWDGVGDNVGMWLRLNDEVEVLGADVGAIVLVDDEVTVHHVAEELDTTTTTCWRAEDLELWVGDTSRAPSASD